MAGYKNGKIMLPIKEFLIVKGQAIYELNTIDMTKVTVFYRKYNQEAFLETYSEMPKGDYRINEVGGNKQLEITNLDILDEYYSIQLARVVDLTSSPYSPSGQVDPITLNQHLNEVIADVTFLFTYLKDVGMVMDSSSGNKILAELKPYTTWYMDKDGNMAAMPVDSLFEKFNDLVQELRQEVLKLLEQDLEVAERELLEEVKRKLDEYVETDLKQRLDDYTTQLEERLQTMIDQAVADKGLIPEGSDWLEIGLGNWLVVDLFNKNYIHYPPQLNSSDNAGVVKKDITDGGNSQVIRFYTTTGKMLFIVRVNEVWSEWQELGEQTDTMQFTQANHGFVFTAVTLDGATRQWVKANKYTSADGIAIKIDNDRFDVVTRGVVNIPTQARDDKGEPFVYDEYYFLSQEVDGGLSRTKNEIGTFQYLAHISEIDNKQVAYIDIGDSYDLDYEVVDKETADRVGIGTYKTTLRTADTIEDLKRLNLKAGDVVEVLGYYTKGDGAGHKRKIESEDDGSGVQLDNGLYANIVHNGELNVSWFGAKGDGVTDDTQAIQKAINICDIVKLNSSKYKVVGTIVLKNNISLDGNDTTFLLEQRTPIFDISQSDIKIKNVSFKTKQQGFYESSRVVILRGEKIEISNCCFIGWDGDAILIDRINNDEPKNPSNIYIIDCYFDGVDRQNRQAISVLAGEYIYIKNNFFTRTTSNNSPASIDIEPYVEKEEVLIKSIYIENNHFEDVREAVHLYCNQSNKNTKVLSDIVVKNNVMKNINECFCYFYQKNKDDSTEFKDGFDDWHSNDIEISGNLILDTDNLLTTKFRTMLIAGMKNITIQNNTIQNSMGLFHIGMTREYKDRTCKNKNIFFVNNNIIGLNRWDTSTAYFRLGINDNLMFANNVILDATSEMEQKSKNLISIECPIFDGTEIRPLQPMQIINNIVTSNSYGVNTFITYPVEIKGKENVTIYGNVLSSNISQNTMIEVLSASDSIELMKSNNLYSDYLSYKNEYINYNIEMIKLSEQEYREPKQNKPITPISLTKFYINNFDENGILKKINVHQLNTPYHINLMEQEGGTTKQDFYAYLGEKFAYDKQLEEEQQAKYEAYQQALTINPNLTYKEFITSYPMMLPNIEEPTIPQSVQEFMKKYL